MNEFLAQLYGTPGSEAVEETEKTAEAMLLDELVKVAAEEGIDLEELSDEDIVEILSEAMSDDTEEKVAADETDEAQLTEDDQEKLAEADFLGRTMAHAFFAELSEIGKEASDEELEKEAGPKTEAFKAKAKDVWRKLTQISSKPGKAPWGKTHKGAKGKAWKKHMQESRALQKKVGIGAGSLAAAGGTGYMMGKKKKASDEAVLARANEIIEAANQVAEAYEKQAADEDALNEQALELLAANDYDVEQIVSLLSDEG